MKTATADLLAGIPAALRLPDHEFASWLSAQRLAVERVDRIIGEVLQEGVHYRRISGHAGDELVLKLPGALALKDALGLDLKWEAQLTRGDGQIEPRISWRVQCWVSFGPRKIRCEGYADTFESAFRWRSGPRRCPSCTAEAIHHRREDGWYCARKERGCGREFAEHDLELISQQVGQELREHTEEFCDEVHAIATARAIRRAVQRFFGGSGLRFSAGEDKGGCEQPEQPTGAQVLEPAEPEVAPDAPAPPEPPTRPRRKRGSRGLQLPGPAALDGILSGAGTLPGRMLGAGAHPPVPGSTRRGSPEDHRAAILVHLSQRRGSSAEFREMAGVVGAVGAQDLMPSGIEALDDEVVEQLRAIMDDRLVCTNVLVDDILDLCADSRMDRTRLNPIAQDVGVETPLTRQVVRGLDEQRALRLLQSLEGELRERAGRAA